MAKDLKKIVPEVLIMIVEKENKNDKSTNQLKTIIGKKIYRYVVYLRHLINFFFE